MDQSDSARTSDAYWRLAVLLPGIAALGLGLLYAAGALIKTGQLQDANLVVRDTLPLVPLEQLLALGIGAIASSTLVVGAFVFLAGFYLWTTRERERSAILVPPKRPARQPVPTRGQRWAIRGFGVFVWALIVFTAAFWLWRYPIFGALSFLAATYFGSWAGNQAREGRRRTTFLFFGAYVAFTLGLGTIEALVSPEPLPKVEIKTPTHQPRSGVLVTSAGSTWYVSFAPRSFRGIPADQIDFAIVRSPEAGEPQPALQWVWDQIK